MNINEDDLTYSVERSITMDIQRNKYQDLLHSINDQPAEVTNKGEILKWYRLGKLHRDNDRPAVINTKTNLMEWHQHGRLHREGGPAYIYNGKGRYSEAWYVNGRRHRMDGPAMSDTNRDGSLDEVWYMHGTGYNGFNAWCNEACVHIDPKEMFLLKLKYG